MSHRPVRISDLAQYAADPDGFVARRGGVRSPDAAAYGIAYHDRFARRRSRRWIVAVLVAAIGVLAALAAWLSG